MDHGVILVTVNYRLGPLGWLSLGDSVLPGNLGLWDILLASQFTRDRISHFGGHPDKGAYIHISPNKQSVCFISPQLVASLSSPG